MQAEYAQAKDNLGHALRKAPHGPRAAGFVQAVHKLMVVVQLLLGEIPERSLFRSPVLANALQPYFALTQAVRLGDLSRFQAVVAAQQPAFLRDRTSTLIHRLHHNVLKAGIRRLCVAYHRIPLADVARKLCLPALGDEQFVLLKAIKDGVVEAEINHAEGFLQSRTVANPYYSAEPQHALHHRIAHLSALHNDSLRAMHYPAGPRRTADGADGDAPPTEAEMIEEYLGGEADADGDDDLGI